jgi:Mce-associated membrane protein
MPEEAVESSGVKRVGAPEPEPEEPTAEPSGSGSSHARIRGRRVPRSGVLPLLAVLGLVGTVVFATLWATKSSGGPSNTAVVAAARTFVLNLTNFDAKSIDSDFAKLSAEATGTFATQAPSVFNAYRQQLENDLVKSEGQIRYLFVQSINGNQASVYAYIDQIFANDKVTTPQSDELQLQLGMNDVNGTWKIAQVVVVNGASSLGSSSTTTTTTTPPAG